MVCKGTNWGRTFFGIIFLNLTLNSAISCTSPNGLWVAAGLPVTKAPLYNEFDDLAAIKKGYDSYSRR